MLESKQSYSLWQNWAADNEGLIRKILQGKDIYENTCSLKKILLTLDLSDIISLLVMGGMYSELRAL